MKPTERFTNHAEDYRLHRPGYPRALIKLIRETCGLKGGDSIGDIGSGTGILTKLLLEAGWEVSAVEPNGPMREAAEADLAPFPRFHSVAATAEATGLPDESFAAITVAQAFHWFDHTAARVEFQRVLQPGGWVFIIRNQRQIDTAPFVRAYEEMLSTLGQLYLDAAHRDNGAGKEHIKTFFAPATPAFACFENPHVLEWPGFKGRFLSSSYAPAIGDQRHEDYLQRLEKIFQEYSVDGRVTFEQQTEVTYGKLV